MARLIQVFEHERLTLTADSLGRYLTANELKCMYQYNDNNKNLYFTGIRNGVKFNSYVGVIQIGSLTLEILPKADNIVRSSLEEHTDVSNTWQGVLLLMLKECRFIRLDAVSEADLKKRHNSILDSYFEIYLRELEDIVRKGLLKQYRQLEGNTNALKGRLLFAKQTTRNLIHQERFYTSHETYDTNNLINQTLKRALTILRYLTYDGLLQDRVTRLQFDFQDIADVAIAQRELERIPINRKTQVYNEALKIAKMIILNYSPDIRNGQESMLALLFDMNKLWEEYIFRMLQKTLPPGFELKFQDGQRFWENRTIRPDIVVRYWNKDDQAETCVIDTKWRIPENNQPSDDELKQMYAYNMYWNASKSILLYPKLSPQKESFGNFHKGRLSDNKCKLGYISVLNAEGKLNRNIGPEILEKVDLIPV